jgi:hypothetical protein
VYGQAMPDQSSASTEHALMQEITAPLATMPDDPVPAVADVDFPTVLRGYDRLAVDAYVQKTSQLVAELQATRSPDAAIRRALERVGEEVSGILQRAHDAAAQITFQSRSEAEDRLEAARREAAQIVSAAEERVRELDVETDRIWSERHRIVEDTRELAHELLTLTDSATERFPAEAGAVDEAPATETETDVGAMVTEEAVLSEEDLELDQDVEPEDIFAEDELEQEAGFGPEFEPGPEIGPHPPDPDVEPTAVLPVVEPDEDEPEARSH